MSGIILTSDRPNTAKKILQNMISLYGETILEDSRSFESIWSDLGGDPKTEELSILTRSVELGLPSRILEKKKSGPPEDLVYQIIEYLREQGMTEEDAIRAISIWTGVLGIDPSPDSSERDGLPATHSLFITSNPVGATIYLEDKTLGSTPLSIPLPEGVHNLRAVMDGYEDTLHTLIMPRNTAIELTLQPRPSFTLSVAAEPPQANVFIDGIYKGTAPLTILNLPGGTHIVLCSSPGYQETRETVQLTSDTTLALRLPKEMAYHTVEIDTSPSGARVAINDEFRGKSPLILSLLEGSYTVSCSLQGHEKENKGIDVSKDSRIKVQMYRKGLRYSPVARKKAVLYGGLVTLTICLLVVIAYGFIIPPPTPVIQSVPKQSAVPIVVQYNPDVQPQSHPQLNGHDISPPYIEKQLQLARDNHEMEYVLANPPLSISWNLVPPMVARTLCYTDEVTNMWVCKNVTRINELSIFTIRVVNAETGETVLEDGFGPRFGATPSRTQRIYKAGIYTISIEGRYLDVNLKIESNN
jgi:hypothetical protein